MKDNFGQELTDCRLCGDKTPMLGTKLCDRCWELESRIRKDQKLAAEILRGLQKEDIGKLENFDEELAVAYLLNQYVLWCGEENGKITIHVLANDLFGPASDCEDITLEELKSLYNEYEQFGDWGTVRWLMRKRKSNPWRQKIIDKMKKEGVWDNEFDNYEPPKY